jgi:hypothetical protein
MTGYHISKNYTVLTIWRFSDRTKVLIGTEFTSPPKHLDRQRRFKSVCRELRRHNLPEPTFIDHRANGARPASTEADRESWIRANLATFPEPSKITDTDIRTIVGAMKSASLYAKSTYFRDAWQFIKKVIEKVRSESK